MNDVKELILIHGLSPKLDLGIDWDTENKELVLATYEKSEITPLGYINPTIDNFEKIRNYQWAYLVKENQKWVQREFPYERIPRELNLDEPIKTYIREGQHEDEVLF